MGSKLDLYCPSGLPSCTWAPIWAAKAHLDVILGSNWASKCLSRVPPTPQNLEFCSTVWHLRHFFNNCLLCSPSALGLLFGTSWGLLGRVLGSTWSLLGASWAQLEISGAPLGLILGHPGRPVRLSRATWAPSWAAKGHLDVKFCCQGALGRQLDANCMTIGHPVSAKLGCQNGCQCQRAS